MRLEIEHNDIDKIRRFYEENKDKKYVKERIRDNIKEYPIDFSEEILWKKMVGCLLTTQQKAGPGAPVEEFLREDPFPLSFESCMRHKSDLQMYTERVLKESQIKGRLRNRNGKFLEQNFDKLNSPDIWKKIAEHKETLSKIRKNEPSYENKTLERKASNYIDVEFKGFGPKQSRHLWQALGYTRYEIPIDSRAVNWLNSNKIFPIYLSKNGLADRNYYEAILDIIQEMCYKADVLPCAFDAALFYYSKESKRN